VDPRHCMSSLLHLQVASLAVATILGASPARASDMPEMEHMAESAAPAHQPPNRDASGTSWQPDLARHSGIHLMAGEWMLMLHGMLWGVYDWQSGPRGDDAFVPLGMIMASARRNLSDADVLQFRAMLSPEPLMGKRGYPLLLQTGETANGTAPLVDRQHPHDLFMELAALWRHQFGHQDGLFLYAGYPGEPALGPPAFMHRASGMDIPAAPITHHWLDSTHIAFGVLTAGWVHGDWKLEVSQFTGREPDQNRYDFDRPRLDSTSARLSWNPDPHWSLQTSWGHLKGAEQLEPEKNEERITASAMFVSPLGEDGQIAATLAWGLKLANDRTNLNGVLLEAEFAPTQPWILFGRAEWEQNNELDVAHQQRSVGEWTVGGLHDWEVLQHIKLGLGALYRSAIVPNALLSAYGNLPRGAMVFVRLTGG
jgi:hypothetical protein